MLMIVGFAGAAAATGQTAGKGATQHCPTAVDGYSGTKVEAEATGTVVSVWDITTQQYIDVVVHIAGTEVTLEPVDSSIVLVDAVWCIKAATTASTGTGLAISTPHTNNGGQIPDVSYVTIYAVASSYQGGYQCWGGETAWAAGDRYVPRGNWATYTPYDGAAAEVMLYAGQTMEAGTVAFSAVDENGMVTITVTLNDGWRFDVSTDEALKVQGYATAPSSNPAPGQFPDKLDATGQTASITVAAAAYYGVHVDVEQQRDSCDDDPSDPDDPYNPYPAS